MRLFYFFQVQRNSVFFLNNILSYVYDITLLPVKCTGIC